MDNFKTINNMILMEYLNKIINYDITDIMIPTLILDGDYDFIPIESSAYISERMPYSRVETIYNSGHYPFIEKTQEFINKVSAFLDE